MGRSPTALGVRDRPPLRHVLTEGRNPRPRVHSYRDLVARIPNDWRSITLITGAVIQTVILLAGVYTLAVTKSDLAGAIALGSWSALGLLGGALYLARPLIDAELAYRGSQPLDKAAATPPAKESSLAPLICGLLPLAQVPLVGGMVWFLSSDPSVDLSYILMDEGVGGAIGTFFITFLVAYLFELLGLLVLLLVGLPLVLLTTALHRYVRNRDGGSLGVALVALIILAILPMSVAAVLAIDGPSGRGGGLGRLLVVLGFESEPYYVVDEGWLWTARIVSLLFLAALITFVVAGKNAAKAAKSRKRG